MYHYVKREIRSPINDLNEVPYIFDNISDHKLSNLRSDDITSKNISNFNIPFRDESYVFKYLKPIYPKCHYKTDTNKEYNKEKIIS